MREESESLILELNRCKGSKIVIFLKNGFRYRGELLKILEDGFILMRDDKINQNKLIAIEQIAEVNFDE